jgi:hypothetical protein
VKKIIAGVVLGLLVSVMVLGPVLALAGRNSGGTYSLPAGNPVTTGTPISSSWANSTLADIANEITNSLDRNGRGNMLAALKLYDGTLGSPGIAFANEAGTGLFRNGAGDLRLAVQGSLKQSWTGSTTAVTNTLDVPTIDRAGTIGIGTTSGTTVTVGRSGQTLSLGGLHHCRSLWHHRNRHGERYHDYDR